MVRQNWRQADRSCEVDIPISRRIRHPALRRWRSNEQKQVLHAPKRRNRRLGALVGFICALLVILTVVVIGWFQPIPRPQLVLISSNLSNSPLMPPTPFVGNDVHALYGLSSELDIADADPDSLSYNEMQAVISRLPDSPILPRWLPWQKRTTLVYCNAAGLGIPPGANQEPIPYLLPDDFGMSLSTVGFPTDRAVAVTELLDKLAAQDSDYKLLVLDCQRFDHFWPLGVLSNRFVDAVQRELRENHERYKGIVVIFSCAPGEVTWAENGYLHTAFAYYFIRGITGPADTVAGNGDGRISAQELFDYVHCNVQQWMAINRTDEQTPIMEAVGVNPADVELLALSSEDQVYATSDPLSCQGGELYEKNISSLQKAWEEYYELSRLNPNPTIFRPHLWRSLEDSLLRAERYFRGADMEAMSEELRKVMLRLQSVEESGKPLAEGAVAYSRPMAQLFGSFHPIEKSGSQGTDTADQTLPAINEGNPTETPATPAEKSLTPKDTVAGPSSTEPGKPENSSDNDSSTPEEKGNGGPANASPAKISNSLATNSMSPAEIWQLITQVIKGTVPANIAAQKLRLANTTKQALPVEGEMLRMMANFGPLASTETPTDEVLNTSRQLLEQRALAEQAAAPAEYLAPRVFPWIQAWVNEGDRLRRIQEDNFFARGNRGVSIGSTVEPVGDTGTQRYQQAIQAADTLANAFTIRDLTLAESVHLVTLCGKRRSSTDVNEFREKIDPMTLSLLGTLDRLDRKLRAGAKHTDNLSENEHILAIGALADWVKNTRDQLLQLVGHEMRDLSRGQASQNTPSAELWRRIDAVLTLPFAYSDEPSATLAERRILLLQRICQHVNPTHDQKIVITKDAVSADEQELLTSDHIKYSRKLAGAFYSLPDSIDLEALESERDASPFSPAIASGWLKTYEFATLATFPERNLDRLLQANTACRIMESYPIAVGLPSDNDLATQKLHREEFAALCAWQGLRLAEDFWAGEPNAEDYYFHRTGQHYLKLAQTIDSEHSICDVTLDNRLAELFAISTRIQQSADGIIFSHPSRLVFRGVDKEELDFAVRLPENTPTGVATLACETAEADVTLRALPDQKSEYPLPYLVERPTAQKVSTRLQANVYYRGHTCSRSLNVRGPADDEGPTVEMRDQRNNDAELVIRPAEVNATPANVLFILDCSRSMLFGQRMETLKTTLEQFAQTVAPGTINVGIRVFGDSVVWQEGNAAAEAAARKDTQLVMPIRPVNTKRFGEVIEDLHAVGESPIIYSLLQAQDDFSGLGKGEQVIVLISDGSDNWAAVGEKPGLQQFEEAYAKNDITVHTVGFQTDVQGFYQLQQIAASTGGHSVRADNGSDLLDNILSLAGVLTYQVTSQPDTSAPEQVYSGIVTYNPEPMKLAPGMYNIAVMGHADQVVATRLGVQLRRGDRYELLYGGGELNYLPSSDLGDVARAVDQETGTQLQILRAELQKGDLVMEFSLSNPRQFGWFPSDVSMQVQGRGADMPYVVRDISPNVSKHHNAVWQIRLADWPSAEYLADVKITWSNVGDPKQTVYPVPWDGVIAPGTLPEEVSLTRREFRTETVNGTLQNVATVALVFPEDYADVQHWSIQLEHQTLESQQTYNVLDAIYTGQFVFPTNTQPQRILVRGPHGPQKNLKTVVDLRAHRIN